MTAVNDESAVLNAIAELADKDFQVIAEASIVYLCDKDKLERFNTLNQALAQVDNCKEVSKWLMKNLMICLKQNIEPAKIAKHFTANLGLNEQKAGLVKQLWEKHYAQIREVADNQTLMISQLVDVEWKFGVTASTSFIDKLGNPFLQLKLVYNQGGKLETSHLEMTLPQFYSFLHEMNKAKSQMEYLS